MLNVHVRKAGFLRRLRHCFGTTLIVLLDVGRLITSRFVFVAH